MSILITGIDMPTEEYGSMTITIYPNSSVMEYIGDIGRSLGYAVPVPPHGRLIDADALANSFDPSDFWNPDAEDNCFAAVHVVNSAPTIIPASEEGK